MALYAKPRFFYVVIVFIQCVKYGGGADNLHTVAFMGTMGGMGRMRKDVKFTNGIISSMTGFKGDELMYQITAAVQPGNCGGPMFDNDGNVTCIVCSKHAEAENANYAIKASYLFSLINSSNLDISLPDINKVKAKSLSKKVKKVKPFVYIVECNSH